MNPELASIVNMWLAGLRRFSKLDVSLADVDVSCMPARQGFDASLQMSSKEGLPYFKSHLHLRNSILKDNRKFVYAERTSRIQGDFVQGPEDTVRVYVGEHPLRRAFLCDEVVLDPNGYGLYRKPDEGYLLMPNGGAFKVFTV